MNTSAMYAILYATALDQEGVKYKKVSGADGVTITLASGPRFVFTDNSSTVSLLDKRGILVGVELARRGMKSLIKRALNL